ncbi:response regulator transcription factor [Paenibacillus solani]|uniref:response regulator transcription factor n=1 Tax=Paenibacillus solani TaxID=1705565 RepID=UPI003D2E7DA6
MKQETILIVDDDQDIVEFISVLLAKEQYRAIQAFNAQDALTYLESEDIQLIVLDVMMPEIDGIELCRRIRESKPIPIIMLSARTSDMDKVFGLGAGADDYISKPFSSIELVARIKAQLRRYTYLNNRTQPVTDHKLTIQELTIDPAARSVSLYGKSVKLTKTEYDILLLLAQNRNRVFTMEEIYEKVWKERYFSGNNSVMVHIARLREKIDDHLRESKIIKNIWGVGYKIEE